MQPIELKPQPGPQEQFITCPADIAIYGGSAGGGKSYGLLLDALRHRYNPHFAGVVFRRTMPEVRMPGGLWEESLKVYGLVQGARPLIMPAEWHFQAGAKVKFAGLEYDHTVLAWHGSQVPFIGFDELCTFSSYQFWYLQSRNRSARAGFKPYIRATCNPDADSWVAELIAWWIDQDTGFPIPERSGVIRWFVRVGDNLVWADRPQDLKPALIGAPEFDDRGNPIPYEPVSLTFIASTIYDNPALLRGDPSYLAKLLALPTLERERLLKGNWKIKPSAGLFFRRTWVEQVEEYQLPKDLLLARGWDLAGTPKTQSNDPDWTCGTKGGKTMDGSGVYYVLDHFRMRGTPGEVETAIDATTRLDGRDCEVWLPQDPGQAGKSQVLNFVQRLDGYSVRYSPESARNVDPAKIQGTAKEVRFRPFSARAEAGHVKVLKGPWNEVWFQQLEGFPDLTHDDDVDSTSRWFNSYLDATSGLVEYYTNEARKLQKEEFEKRNPAPLTELTGVFIKPPENKPINMLYDMKGQPLFLDHEGRFLVDPKHAELLKRSGFVVCQ